MRSSSDLIGMPQNLEGVSAPFGDDRVLTLKYESYAHAPFCPSRLSSPLLFFSLFHSFSILLPFPFHHLLHLRCGCSCVCPFASLPLFKSSSSLDLASWSLSQKPFQMRYPMASPRSTLQMSSRPSRPPCHTCPTSSSLVPSPTAPSSYALSPGACTSTDPPSQQTPSSSSSSRWPWAFISTSASDGRVGGSWPL